MDGLAGYVALFVVSVAAGYALTFIEPKARLVYWPVHVSAFAIPGTATAPSVLLTTHAITVQNTGRRRAEGVEVVHNTVPDHFRIWPTLLHTQKIHQNAHVIEIPVLGPGEWFTVNILTIGEKPVPPLLYVRSRDGQAQQIPVLIQRAFPRWAQYVGAIVFLSGAGFLLYWIIRAIQFISRNVL